MWFKDAVLSWLVLLAGLIPLWMFTLGRLIFARAHEHVKIPYGNIFLSLISILIPVAIGVLIQRKKPNWAKYVIKLIRPIAIIFIIFMFTLGVYANLYIFKLITPQMMLAGCLLPYSGFLLGGLVALICRQPWARIKTIAIETGIQNTGIPIILMKFSLPQPEADLSVVAPVMVATFTPIPLLVGVAYYEIRKRCCRTKKLVIEEDRSNIVTRYDLNESLQDTAEDEINRQSDSFNHNMPHSKI